MNKIDKETRQLEKAFLVHRRVKQLNGKELLLYSAKTYDPDVI